MKGRRYAADDAPAGPGPRGRVLPRQRAMRHAERLASHDILLPAEEAIKIGREVSFPGDKGIERRSAGSALELARLIVEAL